MTDETMTNVDPATGEIFDDAPEQSAELALSQASTQLVQGLAAESEARIEAYGFDPNTPEGVKAIFNAEEDGESLSESGVTELTLRGIIIRPGVRVNPMTNQRTACANTILMTIGHNYVSQSNGIARTAARIAQMFAGNWPADGVQVRVQENKLPNGATYKKLLLA